MRCPWCGNPATMHGNRWECYYCGDSGTLRRPSANHSAQVTLTLKKARCSGAACAQEHLAFSASRKSAAAQHFHRNPERGSFA